MVRRRKAELMEALFPLRTSYHTQCFSSAELEYSYGLHLKDVIHRAGFAYCDNISGFADSNVTLLIIQIGRFFTEIDSSNRPKDYLKGNILGAVEPFAQGPWPENIRHEYTVNELHKRCHDKG